MKAWFRILIVSVLLLVCAITFLYLTGSWIPNDPDKLEFPIRGIDVSGHQGHIDWQKVSSSGIRYVYLKATEGGDFQDAFFRANLLEAHNAGLACGAYHFFSLKTPGAIQAQNFITTVPSTSVSLPPAIDLEFWGNASDRPSPDIFQANLRVYMEAITKAYGREPVIYTSADFSSVYLNHFGLGSFWVRDILLNPNTDGTKAWLFWQYSEKGRVPGIDGFVDLDVFNGTMDRFHTLTQNAATP
jgi:lysozyme